MVVVSFGGHTCHMALFPVGTTDERGRVRLQLTRRGDYGVRAMLELGRRGDEIVSSTDLARATQIPSRFINQVMGDLVRAGLAQSRIGRKGGYRLAKPSTDISVLAIVEAIESDTRRRICVLSTSPCSRESSCEVHAIFTAAQQALMNELAQATLSNALMDGEGPVFPRQAN